MAQLNLFAWSSLALQFIAYYIVPVAFWIFLTGNLRVSWRFVGLGSLTWLTALPFIILVPLGASAMFGNGDPTRFQIVWGSALALTAGIAEETSRYFYYRRNSVLRESSGLQQALVAGAGHGGTEALVLGLQNVIAPLIMLVFMAQALPAYMQDSGAVASFALIGGLSRVMFMLVHIGFTLLVWRAVGRHNPLFYLGAVLLHIAVDLLGFVVPVILPGGDWLVLIPTLPLAGWALLTIMRELRSKRLTTSMPQHSGVAL